MNYGIAILTFLFLSTLGATVMAASSANVSVKNNVNTSSSTGNNTAKVSNHIEVEVNGEKKVIDEVKEGTSVNSNIKVEAKSEDGKTTINVTGDPQTVQSESTKQPEASSPSEMNPSDQDSEVELKEENLFEKISHFFKAVFSIFNLFTNKTGADN